MCQLQLQGQPELQCFDIPSLNEINASQRKLGTKNLSTSNEFGLTTKITLYNHLFTSSFVISYDHNFYTVENI